MSRERIVVLIDGKDDFGHARNIIDIIEKDNRYTIAGIIDNDQRVDDIIFGYTVLGKEEDLPVLQKRHKIFGIVVAAGDNYQRYKTVTRIQELCSDTGIAFVTAVHPDAQIGRGVTIGEGTVITAGAVISTCCQVGRFCLINTNSSLDHDSTMGDYSCLAPRAVTGGACTIGDFSAISIGAVLREEITIGEHTVIGAGATVLKNVSSFTVAYGTPAREIRTRKKGEPYMT